VEKVKSLTFKKLLHAGTGCAPTATMKILFCKANNFPLFDKLPQRGIPYFIKELNMQNKLM
jgi:hypothetical protein